MSGPNLLSPTHRLYLGRYRGLTHIGIPGQPMTVTMRLADSLPCDVLERWRAEFARLPHDQAVARMRVRVDEYLDRGHGACWLRRADVAAIVRRAFERYDGDWYDLHRWTIMPNHTHQLFTLTGRAPLSEVLKHWKGPTGRQANQLLNRKGSFWQNDYFDRHVRDDEHFRRAFEYIDRNPVIAGLVTRPEEWPFGSASLARAEALPPVI